MNQAANGDKKKAPYPFELNPFIAPYPFELKPKHPSNGEREGEGESSTEAKTDLERAMRNLRWRGELESPLKLHSTEEEIALSVKKSHSAKEKCTESGRREESERSGRNE
jgi:hypothetical protein